MKAALSGVDELSRLFPHPGGGRCLPYKAISPGTGSGLGTAVTTRPGTQVGRSFKAMVEEDRLSSTQRAYLFDQRELLVAAWTGRANISL